MAKKRVENAEAVIRQEHKVMGNADNVELTTREPKKMFEEMKVATGDSLSDLASSEDGEDGNDEDDEERELGKLSKDDKPGWAMGTISKMVQQRMERFRQKQKKLDELTEPGWGDTADYFHEGDEMYSTTE